MAERGGRHGSAAPKLELTFERAEEILERLYPNGQLGGVFVEGAPPGPLGMDVELLLRVAKPLPRHFGVQTRLSWVRHRQPRQTEGFGLDFLPEDTHGRERLVAFASGAELSEPIRAEERLHVELEVVVTHAGKERKERLADLSLGGAFLPTLAPLPPGSEVRLSLRPPRSLRKLHLDAKVAWARRGGQDAGMGLQFVSSDARQAERLRRLLERFGNKAR